MFPQANKLSAPFRSSRRTSAAGRQDRKQRLRFEGLERREMMTAESHIPILFPHMPQPSAPPVEMPGAATPASGTQINLSWANEPAGANVVVKELIGGTYQTIGTFGPQTTSDEVTGLKPGTTYSFEICGSNTTPTTFGYSDPSDGVDTGTGRQNGTTTNWEISASATTFQTSAVANPSLAAWVSTGSQVDLSWSAQPGAGGYLVFEQVFGGAWKEIASVGGGTTSYSVQGQPGTNYKFAVEAYNSAGPIWETSATADTVALPDSPRVTATPLTGSEIGLSWNAVSGAAGYVVEEYIGGSWHQIGLLGSGTTSDTVQGLAAGQTYDFKVYAYNAAGKLRGHPRQHDHLQRLVLSKPRRHWDSRSSLGRVLPPTAR